MGKLIFFVTLFFSVHSFGGNKILIILSSENKITLQNGIVHPTGFFLSELAIPLMGLLEKGFEPVFANPLGNAPSMDHMSDSAYWFGGDEKKWIRAQQLVGSLQGLRQPFKLSDIRRQDLAQFAGVFIPGGHAPMEDLAVNRDLGAILTAFHRMGRPTALICHGPISLLAALPNPEDFTQSLRSRHAPVRQDWIYRDYKMTSFSTMEEKQEEPGQDHALGGFVQFYPDLALRLAGGQVVVAPKWQSHVVRDRELITAQNPMSDHEFTQVLLAALDEEKLNPLEQGILGSARGLKNKMVLSISTNALDRYSGQLQFGRLTRIMATPMDLHQGFTIFFVGVRIGSVSVRDFASSLDRHVKLVAEVMGSRGLRGYAVFATPDGEIAVMNWASESDMKAAFEQTGTLIPNDAGKFMKTLAWEKL